MAVETRILINAKDGASRVFQGVSRHTDTLRGKTKLLSASFLNLSSSLGFVIGSAGFTSMIKRTVDSTEELGLFAKTVGISVEALTEMRLILDTNNISQQTFNTSIQRMVRRLDEASRGTGEAVKALDLLNINIEDIIDLEPDKQLELIADAMAALESDAQRVTAAMKLFDTEGVQLVRIMKDGAQGIRDARRAVREMGGSISEDGVKRVSQLNFHIAELAFSFRVLAERITFDAGPSLIELTKTFQLILPKAVLVTSKALNTAVIGILEMAKLTGEVMAFFRSISPFELDNLIAKELKVQVKDLEDLIQSLQSSDDAGGIEKFNNQLSEIPSKLGSIKVEAEEVEETFGNLEKSLDGVADSFDRALADLVFDTSRASEIIKSLFLDVSRQLFRQNVSQPAINLLSAAIQGAFTSQAQISGISGDSGIGAFQAVGNAKGNVFAGGRLVPMAKGGVITGPSILPFAGESGPEAILPLQRDSRGNLGVGAGGGAMVVNQSFNITTPDVDGFRRSETQVLSEARRLLAGVRR